MSLENHLLQKFKSQLHSRKIPKISNIIGKVSAFIADAQENIHLDFNGEITQASLLDAIDEYYAQYGIKHNGYNSGWRTYVAHPVHLGLEIRLTDSWCQVTVHDYNSF